MFKIIEIIYSCSKGPKLIRGWEGRENFERDKETVTKQSNEIYALLSLEKQLGPIDERGREESFDLLSERVVLTF